MVDTKKTYSTANDNEMKIRKGQAYNLAIMSAGFAGKINDNEYIIKQFTKHMQLSNLLQKASNEQLVAAINNPELIELFSKLETLLGK